MTKDINKDSPSSRGNLSRQLLQSRLTSAAKRLSDREKIAQEINSQDDKSVTISFAIRKSRPFIFTQLGKVSQILYILKLKCYEIEEKQIAEQRPQFLLSRSLIFMRDDLGPVDYLSSKDKLSCDYVSTYSATINGQVRSRKVSGERQWYGLLQKGQLEDLSYLSGYSVAHIRVILRLYYQARWKGSSGTLAIPLPLPQNNETHVLIPEVPIKVINYQRPKNSTKSEKVKHCEDK